MIALFTGLFMGFLMCIPIGPINVWVINTQVKKSTGRALSIALGGSLMDFVYFYAILTGLSLFQLSGKNLILFKILGIVAIFLMGIKELIFPAKVEFALKARESAKGVLGGVLLGILIYTSNPTLVITMSGLGTFIKSLDLFLFSPINIFAISLGLAAGSFLWFVFLTRVVERYEGSIRSKYFNYFSQLSGGLMVCLSVYMGYQFFNLEYLK